MFYNVNIDNTTVKIPVITDAEDDYEYVSAGRCNCKYTTKYAKNFWHLDGIFARTNDDKKFLCITCRSCGYKFMEPMNVSDLYAFIIKQSYEFSQNK